MVVEDILKFILTNMLGNPLVAVMVHLGQELHLVVEMVPKVMLHFIQHQE
jgi:hypothetical protein